MTKADMYPERVTLVVSSEQRGMVEEFAREVMRNGTWKYERVTPNTVMRCLINLLGGFNADLTNIRDEEDLNEVMRNFFLKRKVPYCNVIKLQRLNKRHRKER